MPGLLSSDTEIENYLQDMLFGTRTNTVPFNGGPFYGSIGQHRPAMPVPAWQQEQPSTMGTVGLRGEAGRFSGNLGVTGKADDGSSMQISPEVRAALGPVWLSGGLDYRSNPDGTTLAPRFGAGVNIPMGDTNLSAGANLTPQQLLNLSAQLSHKIDPQSEIALMLNHARPTGGVPDTRFGIAYHRKF